MTPRGPRRALQHSQITQQARCQCQIAGVTIMQRPTLRRAPVITWRRWERTSTCACVCACVRACVRAYMRACIHVCVCVRACVTGTMVAAMTQHSPVWKEPLPQRQDTFVADRLAKAIDHAFVQRPSTVRTHWLTHHSALDYIEWAAEDSTEKS
jgi:hypothetical protein